MEGWNTKSFNRHTESKEFPSLSLYHIRQEIRALFVLIKGLKCSSPPYHGCEIFQMLNFDLGLANLKMFNLAEPLKSIIALYMEAWTWSHLTDISFIMQYN